MFILIQNLMLCFFSGDYSILSNMVIPEKMHIPSHSFLHTVCVSEGSQSGLFVTVAFGVYDNLKKVQAVEKMSSLSYRSVPFDEALRYLGHTQVGPATGNYSTYILHTVIKTFVVAAFVLPVLLIQRRLTLKYSHDSCLSYSDSIGYSNTDLFQGRYVFN